VRDARDCTNALHGIETHPRDGVGWESVPDAAGEMLVQLLNQLTANVRAARGTRVLELFFHPRFGWVLLTAAHFVMTDDVDAYLEENQVPEERQYLTLVEALRMGLRANSDA
jgi:hypothetical protein